jgi:hypothetical protein
MGFINIDSIKNSSAFKSTTKNFISALNYSAGTGELKPKYIYPKDIDRQNLASYMIIYVYDNIHSKTVFQPISTDIAKSKVQNDIARKLTDCVSVKISDKAKDKLKQYKSAINDYLRNSLKDVFSADGLKGLVGKLGIETPEWIKDTADFLKDNQLTRGIKELINEIDLPSFPGIDISSDFSISGVTDLIDVKFDKEKFNSIVAELKGVQNSDAYDALASEAGEGFQLVTSVVLPLPTNGISYETKVDISMESTKTAKAITNIIHDVINTYNKSNNSGSEDGSWKKMTNGITAAFKATKAGVQSVGGTVMSQGTELLYGLLGNQGKALFQSETGLVRDPLNVFVFNMPDARTFQYDFLMAPRNKQELFDIYNIIKTLKFYSAMDVASDSNSVRYFNMPGRFKIKYYTEGNENYWLGKTKVMGLTSIRTSIDTNQGFILNDFDKVSGSAPKLIGMTLQFTELSQMNRTDINEGY